MTLYTQPTPAPTRKIAVGGLAGLAVAVLLGVLQQFVAVEGVAIEIAGEYDPFVVLLTSLIASWFVKERKQE